jgi:polysaccharide biosynthesis/export protein
MAKDDMQSLQEPESPFDPVEATNSVRGVRYVCRARIVGSSKHGGVRAHDGIETTAKRAFMSGTPVNERLSEPGLPNRGVGNIVTLSKAVTALAVSLCLTGCGSHLYKHLPAHDAAYRIIPPIQDAVDPGKYLITPGDEMTYSVLGEPDMTIQKLIVDDAGYIQVPLVGAIKVGGRTTADAKHQIEGVLGARYIKDPDVTINITTPMPHLVNVEGEVTQPGSYAITRDTTLLGALALAKSPTNKASLDEVVIFRTINHQRMVARFNISRIRTGLDPDPQILGGDVVMVGLSHAKSMYRDILTAAPLLNAFATFRNY